MTYVLQVPDGIERSYFRWGRRGLKRHDGYIAKGEFRDWSLQLTIQRAHRWKTREKAEAAALLVVMKLPEVMGKLMIVEVVKQGKVWRRARLAPRSHRDW